MEYLNLLSTSTYSSRFFGTTFYFLESRKFSHYFYFLRSRIFTTYFYFLESSKVIYFWQHWPHPHTGTGQVRRCWRQLDLEELKHDIQQSVLDFRFPLPPSWAEHLSVSLFESSSIQQFSSLPSTWVVRISMLSVQLDRRLQLLLLFSSLLLSYNSGLQQGLWYR